MEDYLYLQHMGLKHTYIYNLLLYVKTFIDKVYKRC